MIRRAGSLVMLYFILTLGYSQAEAQGMNQDLLENHANKVYAEIGLIDTLLKRLKKSFDITRDLEHPQKSGKQRKEEFKIIAIANTNQVDSILGPLNKLFYNSQIESLFELTRQEFMEYRMSLDLVKKESTTLFKKDLIMNNFDVANLLNAYYNYLRCRSSLTQAIGNVRRHHSLALLAGNIKVKSDSIESRTGTIKHNIAKIDSTADRTFKLLSEDFVPYSNKVKPFPKSDKVSGSANYILRDSRSNWWWRTLIGGAVGGIIAGLTVSFLK